MLNEPLTPPLYHFRTIADDLTWPAASRYRAVRNALSASLNGATTVAIESKLTTDPEGAWDLDEEGMRTYREEQEKSLHGQDTTAPDTLAQALKQLGNVCRILSVRSFITPAETRILAETMQRVVNLIESETEEPL